MRLQMLRRLAGAVLLALSLTAIASAGVNAQMSFDGGGANGGAIRFGASTDTCAAGIAGAVRYSGGTLQLCDGSTWTAVGSGGAVGGGWTDDGTTVRLTTATDKVGIGTASPQVDLHVLNTTGGATTVVEASSGNSAASLVLKPAGIGNAFFAFGTATGNQLVFYSEKTGVADVMTLDGGGNVGIGTMSPTQLLSLGDTHSQIGTDSLDGADNKRLQISGAGASATRGAYINLYGNEFAGNEGTLALVAGASGVSGQGVIAFITGNSLERMRVDDAGNVGIGTATAAAKLHLIKDSLSTSESQAGIAIATAASNYRKLLLGVDETNDTAYVQSMTHNSYATTPLALNPNGGNVGIGTTGPETLLHIYGDTTRNKLLVEGNISSGGTFKTFHSGTEAPAVVLARARGTKASPTPLQADDSIGNLTFQGFDDAFGQAAQIAAYADAEHFTAGDTTDTPSRLEFGVTADGSSTLATALTIKNTGNVGIGTASPGDNLTIKPSANGAGIDVRESDDGFRAAEISGLVGGGTIGLFAGGVEKIFLNGTGDSYFNSGNVGIGTASPSATSRLHVVDAAVNGSAAYFQQTNATNSNGVVIVTQTAGGGDIGLLVRSAGGTKEILATRNDGKVGIGTASPGANLEINATSGNVTARIGSPANQNPILDFAPTTAGYVSYINYGNTSGAPLYLQSKKTGAPQGLVIDADSKVGIGTPSPTAKLHVAGDLLVTATSGITNSSVGAISSASNLCYNTSSGQFGACTSDERLKTKIASIEESGIDVINRLRAVTFAWKDTPDVIQAGFIAQEVMKVIPSAVYDADNGYLGFKSDQVLPFLVKAAQEQQGEIEALRAQNEALAAENAALDARLDAIEARLAE